MGRSVLRLSFVVLVLVLGAGRMAVAADMPIKAPPPAAPPAYSWNGIYLGINGGFADGDSRYNFGDGFSTNAFDVSGPTVGGTLGLNWQNGSWVLGIEGDGNWSDIDGSTLCPNLINTCKTSNTWLATVRGRLGYAVDRFLIYVTGGAAFGDIKADIPGFGSSSGTETGWTAGGGIEFAIAGNWTGKLEYLHVDLGEFNCDFSCSAVLPGTDEFKANIIRAGLNYRFNWAGPAARY
jgi:outer membrane immunogenic protein